MNANLTLIGKEENHGRTADIQLQNLAKRLGVRRPSTPLSIPLRLPGSTLTEIQSGVAFADSLPAALQNPVGLPVAS